MKLFVPLLPEDDTSQVKLYCYHVLAQECTLAKQESIRKDLRFALPVKVVGEGSELTLQLNTFNLPKQQLQEWAGASAAINLLKSGAVELEIRDISATPSGFFKAVISADNFSINFQGFLGFKIDIGVMGKVEQPEQRPIRESTMVCAGDTHDVG